MGQRVDDLVRRPSQFFASSSPRPSLLGPALIAIALGMTAVVRLLALLTVLGDVADGFQGTPLIYAIGQFNVSAPRDLVAASLVVFLLFFLGWVLAAGVIYAVSRYFDPDGSFRDLFALVGWGQFPILIPALLSTSYILYASAQAPEITSEAAAMEWAETWFLDSPAGQLTNYVDPIFAVWSSYLWLLAAEAALGLTRRQALVCIALPAGLQILNSIGGFFTITG